MAHPTSLWRGRRVCTHTVPKLDQWAASTGTAYTVKLIQGSYNVVNPKSGGTHDKGGAADAEGDGFSASVLNTASNKARACILLSYARLWKGNWHIHLLDPDCRDLSAQACAQFVLFGRGFDALVGNNPDPGSRVHAARIMHAYNTRFEEDMDLTPANLTAIAKAVWADPPWDGKPGVPGSTAGNNLGWQSAWGERTDKNVAAILKRLDAIESKLP